MKLIDADKLKLEIRDNPNINGDNFATIKRHIDDAPTIDAVEVVRCKECLYRGNECECPLLSLEQYTEEWEYCSFGERRTE